MFEDVGRRDSHTLPRRLSSRQLAGLLVTAPSQRTTSSVSAGWRCGKNEYVEEAGEMIAVNIMDCGNWIQD